MAFLPLPKIAGAEKSCAVFPVISVMVGLIDGLGTVVVVVVGTGFLVISVRVALLDLPSLSESLI